MFYEHVHFKFEANYVLARALAEPVSRLLPVAVTSGAKTQSDWLTEAECARQLVWTDWNRYYALQRLPFKTPPFTYQLDHAEKLLGVQKQLSQLSSRLTPSALRQTLEDYRAAVARAPSDWVFWKDLGTLQEELGDWNEAGKSFQRVTQLLPEEAEGFLDWALALTKQGRADEAAQEFYVARGLDEEMTRATFVKQYTEAAAAAFQKGNVPVAILMSRKALELRPYSTVNLLNLAEALLAAGKNEEAVAPLRTALQHPPDTLDELTQLGQACLRRGWTNEARTSFEAALRIDPADPAAHQGLANIR